jgi:hypothetical protein
VARRGCQLVSDDWARAVEAAVLPSLLSLLAGDPCSFRSSAAKIYCFRPTCVFCSFFFCFVLDEMSFIEWVAQKVNFVQPPHLSYSLSFYL